MKVNKNSFWTVSFLVVIGFAAILTGAITGRLSISGIGVIIIGALILNYFFQKKLKKYEKE